MKKLVICGGGSSAHTLIPLLNNSGFEVSIYTSRPNKWHSQIELEWHDPSGNVLGSYNGRLEKASNGRRSILHYIQTIEINLGKELSKMANNKPIDINGKEIGNGGKEFLKLP